MPDRLRLPPRAGLARRLLYRLPTVVSDTVLFSVVIYSVGCVIPTPLDPAPAPTNYAPLFVTDKVNPQFGPITHTQSEAFDLNVVVDDPDVNDPSSMDEMHARLFFRSLGDTGTMVWDGSDISLLAPSVPNPMSPNLRFGSFPAAARCFNRTGVQYLYAVVSDRRFDSTVPTKTNGQTDTNHWELTCTP